MGLKGGINTRGRFRVVISPLDKRYPSKEVSSLHIQPHSTPNLLGVLKPSYNMADAAIQVAETIQTAHINRHPSPTHDINPSTAASAKEPVVISPQSSSAAGSIATDEVPLSALRPQRRHNQMPPLPDLRFEQSYLASIKDAKGPGMVAWITVRDQV